MDPSTRLPETNSIRWESRPRYEKNGKERWQKQKRREMNRELRARRAADLPLFGQGQPQLRVEKVRIVFVQPKGEGKQGWVVSCERKKKLQHTRKGRERE